MKENTNNNSQKLPQHANPGKSNHTSSIVTDKATVPENNETKPSTNDVRFGLDDISAIAGKLTSSEENY